MPSIDVDTTVPFPCRDVFRAVSAFEHYPELMPLIEKSAVDPDSRRVRFDFNTKSLLGQMLATFSPTGKSYQISEVSLKPDSEITARSLEGPLQSMNLRYAFSPGGPDRTHVALHIDFATGQGTVADFAAKIILKDQAALAVHEMGPRLKSVLAKLDAPKAL